MDTIRILDQRIDRSLWPLEPAEAGQCHFIWTDAPHRRRSREEDERTIASLSTESKKNRKIATMAESSDGGLLGKMQQACRRSIRVPRKQVRKLLGRAEEIRQQTQRQGHDGERRWSEATLVESGCRQEERTKVKDQ